MCEQVLEEQKCEEDVFCLSVNYLDRVLSVLPLRKTQLQLIASVCMFVASKFTDTVALSAERLVMYTDYSITVDQLLVSYTFNAAYSNTLHWLLSCFTRFTLRHRGLNGVGLLMYYWWLLLGRDCVVNNVILMLMTRRDERSLEFTTLHPIFCTQTTIKTTISPTVVVKLHIELATENFLCDSWVLYHRHISSMTVDQSWNIETWGQSGHVH